MPCNYKKKKRKMMNMMGAEYKPNYAHKGKSVMGEVRNATTSKMNYKRKKKMLLKEY